MLMLFRRAVAVRRASTSPISFPPPPARIKMRGSRQLVGYAKDGLVLRLSRAPKVAIAGRACWLSRRPTVRSNRFRNHAAPGAGARLRSVR